MLGHLRTCKPAYAAPAELHPREKALIDLGLPLGEPLVASWTHHSPIPSTCKSSDELSNTAAPPCILGVDEAGRGPVLGPMVYGICYAAFSEQDFVAKLGVDDSKVLTEPMRNPLFESMQLPHQRERIGWAVKVLSPQDLSNWMLRTAKYNLNAIAHDTTIGLIKETLARGVNVKEVYVDTVGPPEKYQDKLSRIFPGIQFTVTKKADSLFPIVSAASICAKVIRDAVLLHWRFSESIAPINRDELTYSPGLDANNSNSSPWSTQFGSGYPSDPNTVKWLHGHLDPVFGYPGIIRFSWATCEKLVNAKGVEVKWPDVEDAAMEPSVYTSKAMLTKATRPRPLRTVDQFAESIRPRISTGVFTRISPESLQQSRARLHDKPVHAAVEQSRRRARPFFKSRNLQLVNAVSL